MLNNANGFKKIYIATGYTDLRRGMEGLAAIIRFQFNLDPYDKDTLFLFCGKRTDRIKGLLWEGDGFLLLYKRLYSGAFQYCTVSGRGKRNLAGSIPDADAGT
ncbi:MAG: IS66 family insertion sequence element accessory protein TnpB [Roseburia hominis]